LLVMNTGKDHPSLTSKVVRNYVRHHKLAANQLSDLILTVHQAISQLGQPPVQEEARTPAVSVRRSVHQDYVVCLDCGFRGISLRRHIRTRHGLSKAEYVQRWGLRSDHPLTAPAYSERRAAIAKVIWLGRNMATQMATAATPVVAARPVDTDRKSQATPARRRRSRFRSKPTDVVSEAVVTPSPARRGRPRSRAASPPPTQTPSRS